MRTFRFLNLAILSVLVGSTALAYAQEEKKEEPARQEEAKPQPKEEAKPGKQEKEMKQDQKHEEQAGKEEHKQMQDDHARPEHADQHAQAGHPAGKSGHIPDDKFRSHFGQGHHFSAKTVIVRGQPQFHYSGYTFNIVDAWPVEWAYTDDCYIDYIDGEYFLFDVLHPGVRIALFVVL
jgi:uncharacterized protein involved in copper resistance